MACESPRFNHQTCVSSGFRGALEGCKHPPCQTCPSTASLQRQVHVLQTGFDDAQLKLTDTQTQLKDTCHMLDVARTAEEKQTMLLSRIKCQLQTEQLYQDATHVMVDRAAQLESDLEQTALMLCQEMAAATSTEQLLQQSRQQCTHQQNLNFRAMTEVANLRWQLQMQHQVLAMSQAELCKTRAEVAEARNLNANIGNKSPSAQTTAAADCDTHQTHVRGITPAVINNRGDKHFDVQQPADKLSRSCSCSL